MLRDIITIVKRSLRIYPKSLITPREGDLLEELGSQAILAIVEIGSWIGESTIRLAKRSSVNVYAIDPHYGSRSHSVHGAENTYSMLISNINKAKLSHKVIPLVMTAEEAYNRYPDLVCGFIFIDGSHIYEDVKQDFELWSKRLVDGGIIALHDVGNPNMPGPDKVWKEYVENIDTYTQLGRVDSISYAKKQKEEDICL